MSMPQGHAHASQELVHSKGLGEVVVCACIECHDLVILSPPCGKDDDGHAARLTQLARHFDSISVGKAQIEQHELWIVACDQRRHFCGSLGLDDPVPV